MDADNWVHHYDVIHAQDNKVGAFMQRERKLSSNDDWVLYSACGTELAVLIDTTRRSGLVSQLIPFYGLFAPHRLVLSRPGGDLVARYDKGLGLRYELTVEVGDRPSSIDETNVFAAGVLAATHNLRVT